jgi:hypothetical protein
MKIKHALHAAAFAITVAFAGASHADNYLNNVVTAETIWNDGGKVLSSLPGFPGANVTVYDMVNTDLGKSFLAFCIEPTVVLGAGYSTNYASLDMGAQFQDKASLVKALYGTSYASIFSDSTHYGLNADQMKQAFQLALWDAGNDDGNIYGDGAQSYVFGSADGSDGRVLAAQGMLAAAGNAVTQEQPYTSYNFIAFKAGDGQTLMSVSAVPEADTWAMLAAGLGLIGFMGRRQPRRSEKFAA